MTRNGQLLPFSIVIKVIWYKKKKEISRCNTNLFLRIDERKRIYKSNGYNFLSLSLNYFHRNVNAISKIKRDTTNDKLIYIYIERKPPLIFLKSFHTHPLP